MRSELTEGDILEDPTTCQQYEVASPVYKNGWVMLKPAGGRTPPAEGREQKPVVYVSQELIDGECVGSMAYAVQPTPKHVPVYTAPADTEQPSEATPAEALAAWNAKSDDYKCGYLQGGYDARHKKPSEAEQEMPPCPKCDYELDQLGSCPNCNKPITAQEAVAALDLVLGYRTQLATAIEYGKHAVVGASNRLRRYIEQTAQDREDAAKYRELIYNVASKFPGESCHETALRYIRNAENQCNGPEDARQQEQGQG